MDALLLAKASVLLAVTLAAARLLRGAPAAGRHHLWTVAFTAMLALPLLAVAMPVVHVPVPSCCVGATGTIAPAMSVATPAVHEISVAPPVTSATIVEGALIAPSPARPHWPSARTILVSAWVAGTVTAVSLLLLSLVRVRRLARCAEALEDEQWMRAAETLGGRLGLRHPARLFVSAAVGTPMAGGVWRSAIFLPSSARSWTAERRDVVLAHELAHLAGHDPLRHVAARLAVALYWFHPLAWMAARQAAVAREQACDEMVLRLGTRPSSYAKVLLELAESLSPTAAGLGALPMVERTNMETRLMTILNDEVRPVTKRGALAPALAIAVIALAVAAAQPTARAAAVRTIAEAPDVAQPGGDGAPLQPARDSACWSDMRSGASFDGTTSTSLVSGVGVINEQVGSRGADRVIQKTFGDLRVCMVAEGIGARSGTERPSQWPGRARRVVVEARRGGVMQRLEIVAAGGAPRASWQVGGKDRPFDAAAEQWRDRILAVLDTTWEVSTLRGQVSTLRGEISTLRGEESTLRGQISLLRGEVSTMRGQQSLVRGDESSLRGEISMMHGHVSALRGAISTEQGAISSLQAAGDEPEDVRRNRDLMARHEREIARLEQELLDYHADAKIGEVERQIQALAADQKVQTTEDEIRRFDVDGRVAAIEKHIADLNVDAKAAAIERQIAALDADRRTRQLEDRGDEELKRFEAAAAAIR